MKPQFSEVKIIQVFQNHQPDENMGLREKNNPSEAVGSTDPLSDKKHHCAVAQNPHLKPYAFDPPTTMTQKQQIHEVSNL